MTSIGVITELEDLRLYLQERVREYDSTIDTGLGSTFDSTVIQPLINRIGPDPYITDIVDFIHGRLRGEFDSSELVLQDGEPIDDLVIRPNRVLLEAFRRQIRLVALNQSLANPELLNEKEADDLASNFFVRRNQGGFSVGPARLYYTAPQFALVNPSNSLFTGSGLQYFPIEPQAIQADRMVFNEEDNLFYFDIIVRSEQQGSDYNIPANTLSSIEGVPSVVKVTNKRAFEGGGDKEETQALVERTENSLTEKSLVTTRGINARLLDTFENIQLIQVIGFGDPEMDRDIIEGASESAPYAAFLGDTDTSDVISLNLASSSPILEEDGTGSSSFIASGVQVGDLVDNYMNGLDKIEIYTVTEVIDATNLRVSPNPTETVTNKFLLRRAAGGITISNIPGGILGPDPTIKIVSGEVHIGGAYDVFVRAGDPQDRDITLEGILDAEPLRFGLDLESYGSEGGQVAHVTQDIDNVAAIPNTDRFGNAIAATADLLEVVIKTLDDSATTEFDPWVPTEDDVGRHIQIREPAPSKHHGTFLITEFIGEEYYSGERCVRVKIDKANVERSNADAEWLALGPEENNLDLKVRIAEEVSVKNRVRDLDLSTVVVPENDPAGRPAILGGADFGVAGVEIGDSVIIETGNDAGIYSIRRVLDWLATGDALVLDRDLTDTVVTTGPNTGLRYRIADELNVDLVAPRVPKIPLGNIFAGDDLSSIAGSNIVSVTGSTNFLLAGVEEGDTLEILEGTNIGRYTVSSVTGATAELDRAVLSTLSNQNFEVYRAFTGVTRPMVNVDEIELLDSNSQPTGITIPYGDAIDARILGTLSNRAQGQVVESFTGELQNNGIGYVDLEDINTNFDLEGVEAGYRLNVLSGDSEGSYTIIGTGTDPAIGLTANVIRVAAANGGTAFLGADTDVHYSIGLPSSGIVRLFFLEPTSAEITTGLAGGRIQYSEGGVTPKVFQFSPVTGFNIVPPPGDPDDDARDLRVVRSYLELVTSRSNTGTTTVGTGIYTDADTFITDGVRVGDTLRLSNGTSGLDNEDYTIVSVDSETQVTVDATFNGDTTIDHEVLRYRTVVELTDPNRPGVYELEIQEGDTVEVNEPIPFRLPNSGAPFTGQTFDEAGVFGATAPLRTRAGDNLVSVPPNSLIDFQVMDSSFPLVGQTLYIESGLDAGAYIIEEVVSNKELRLGAVMTSTTGSLEARDVNSRAGLVLSDSAPNTKLQDTDDSGQVALLATGQYVTVFESTRSDIDGTYQITDNLPTSPDTVELEFSMTDHFSGSGTGSLDTKGVGPFSWIATDTDSPGHAFHIYKSVATEFEVLEVATNAGFNTAFTGTTRADITVPDQLEDKSGLMAANPLQRGDIIEVLNEGVLQGIYHAESVSGSTVTIHSEVPFPLSMNDVAVRFWGGMVGSRRMLTLGPKDSSTGRVAIGDFIPYRVIRTAIQRLSSTEMEENFDGTLYYVDVEIESEGSGDDLNLSEGSRMEVTSGLRVDGYTYSVDNETLTFSSFEEVSLNFDRRFLPVGNSDSPENLTEISGRNLKVVYSTSTTTKLVNDLLRSDRDRVVNASPIARHFLPSYVYTSLQYRGGISEDSMGPLLEDLVNKKGAEDELRVSDLETVLLKNGAEAIEHPIEIVTVTHDLGRQLVVNRSDNKVGGANAVPFNGTGRLSAFFTEYEETLLLVRES